MYVEPLDGSTIACANEPEETNSLPESSLHSLPDPPMNDVLSFVRSFLMGGWGKCTLKLGTLDGSAIACDATNLKKPTPSPESSLHSLPDPPMNAVLSFVRSFLMGGWGKCTLKLGTLDRSAIACATNLKKPTPSPESSLHSLPDPPMNDVLSFVRSFLMGGW